VAFPHPTNWFGMDPQQACDLAALLIQHARQCGVLVKVEI